MKKRQGWGTALCAGALLMVCNAAWAQKQACCPKYEVSAEKVIKGMIEEVVEKIGQAHVRGLHLMVRAGEDVTDGKQLYDVHVGPLRYVDKQGFKFAAGDLVEIICAPVHAWPGEGEDLEVLEVVAREVRLGDEVIHLRAEDGRPLWQGEGRRGHKPPPTS